MTYFLFKQEAGVGHIKAPSSFKHPKTLSLKCSMTKLNWCLLLYWGGGFNTHLHKYINGKFRGNSHAQLNIHPLIQKKLLYQPITDLIPKHCASLICTNTYFRYMEHNRNGLQATKHPIWFNFARGRSRQRVCMRYRAVRNKLDLINHLLLRWSDSRSSQGETESWISETPRTAGSATVTLCETYQRLPLDFHGCLWLIIKIWCRDGQAYVQRLCFIHNWLPIILSITNKPHVSL